MYMCTVHVNECTVAFLTLAPNSIAITPDAVFAIRAGIKKESTARKLLYPPPAAAKLLQFYDKRSFVLQ